MSSIISALDLMPRYGMEPTPLAAPAPMDPSILKRLNENDSTLTKLDLSKKKLNADGYKALAEALKVNRSLLQLELSASDLGAEGGRMVAEALKVNRSLQQLRLDENNLDGYVGIALAEALKINRSLTVLDLSVNDFGTGGGKALVETLKVNNSLLQLKLARIRLNAEGGRALAEALKVNRSLLELDLSNSLGGEEGKVIAEGLKVNLSLQRLNLNGTYLDVEAGQAIAEALKINSSLQQLDLSFNILGAEGGKALAEALKVNRSLKQFDLSSNHLGADGVRALAEALKINSSLQQLNLRFNNLGAEGGKALIEALKVNRSLKQLVLSFNNLGIEESKALAETLKVNGSLQQLGLVGNELRAEGGEAFAEALEANETLTALDYSDDDISDDVSDYIQQKLEQNKHRAEKQAQEAKEKKVKVAATNVPAHTQPSSKKAPAGKSPLIDPQKKEKAALDDATVQKLQALADKLQVIDVAALHALQGDATQLQRLFDREAKAEHADAERKRIDADPALTIYHCFFVRLLTGTWLACQSISSGLVENTDKYKSDRVGQGLDAIGKHIPGISAVTSIFSGAISAWNNRERRQGVQKIALLFPDLETAFKELGTLARQATLAQEAAIKQLPAHATGFVARAKERAQDFKAAILADDVDTPLKRKAVADCETILTAIRDSRPCPNPTTAALLTVLLGRSYTHTPSTVSPSSSVTPQSPSFSQTPSSPSMSMEEMMAEMKQLRDRDEARAAEVKGLKERDDAREREMKAMKQRLAAQEDNEAVVAGGNLAQAESKANSALNRRDVASLNRAQADASITRQELDTMKAEGAHTRARVEEHDGKLMELAAGLDNMKKKSRRKTKCLVM